jgi:hypothetical protein
VLEVLHPILEEVVAVPAVLLPTQVMLSQQVRLYLLPWALAVQVQPLVPAAPVQVPIRCLEPSLHWVEVLVDTMHLTPLAQQADQAAVVVVRVLLHMEQVINRQVAVAAWAIEAASVLMEPMQAVVAAAQVQLALTIQVVQEAMEA